MPSLAGTGRRQLLICIEAIDPAIDRFRRHDASGGVRRACMENALSFLGVPTPSVRACLGGRSSTSGEVHRVHDGKIALSEPGCPSKSQSRASAEPLL